MAVVDFFGKPGCLGNRRQREALSLAGHSVIAHDLLGEPWTASSLGRFLEGVPVAQWFNRSSPRIKAGELDPDQLAAEAALALLLADPGLIRRPLMISDGRHVLGWERAQVEAWLGLDPATPGPASDACAHRPQESAVCQETGS